MKSGAEKYTFIKPTWIKVHAAFKPTTFKNFSSHKVKQSKIC